MIAPDVLIVDLEPEGFALLSELASKRVYRTAPEIHVLHRSGKVLNVVHTTEGVIDKFREHFDDPASRAREILATSGAERVILVDKDPISELSTAQVDLARRVETQTELLWRANQMFFSAPGVAVSPKAKPSFWGAIFERAAAPRGDYWAVFGAWSEEMLAVSLIARIQRGLITLLTSADHFGERPGRSQASRLIDMVEEQGPVVLALGCDLDDLKRLFSSEDPLAELSDLIRREVIFERGVGGLLPEVVAD